MKYLLLFIAQCMLSLSLFASHVAGGNFEYEYVSENVYNIRFEVLRDCSGDPFDAPTLYRSSTSCGYSCSPVGTMSLVSSESIDYGCGNTCDDPDIGLIGYELYVYELTVALPEECTDWRFSVNIVARNFVDFGASGTYFNYILINNTTGFTNDSPDFINVNAFLGCTGLYSDFVNTYTDSEGDEITFELVSALIGEAVVSDYCLNFDIPLDGGEIPLSGSNPFPSEEGSFILNESTGNFGFTPTLSGVSIYALKFTERRDGTVMSEGIRDGQIIITNCPSGAETEISDWVDEDETFIQFSRDDLGCGEISIDSDESIDIVEIPNLPEGLTYEVVGLGSETVIVEICADFDLIPANCEAKVLSFDLKVGGENCFYAGYTTKKFQYIIEPIGYCNEYRFFTDISLEEGASFPSFAIAEKEIWVGDAMPPYSGIAPAEMGAVEIDKDITLQAGEEIIFPACVSGTGCVTFSGATNRTFVIKPNSCSPDCPVEVLDIDIYKAFNCQDEKAIAYTDGGVAPFTYIWRNESNDIIGTSFIYDLHETLSEKEWTDETLIKLEVTDATGAYGETEVTFNGTKRFYEPVTNNVIWFEYPEEHIADDGYYYAGQPGTSIERPFFIADSVNLSPPWYGATQIDLYVWDRWDAGMGEVGETIHANFYSNSWDIEGSDDWSLDNGEVYWNGHWNNDVEEDCPGSSPELWVYQVSARNCLTPAEEPDDWEHVELAVLIKYNCFDGDWSPSIDVTKSVNSDVNERDTLNMRYIDYLIEDNTELSTEETVRVAPNPVGNELIVLGNKNGIKIKSLTVYNSVGIAVKSNANQNKIDISELSSGTYMVSIVTDDDEVFNLKFVKL